MHNSSNGRVWSIDTGLLLVASATLALTSAACGVEDDGVEGHDQLRLVELVDDATCVTLYAGQTIDVGSVCVAIDNTVDTSASCGAGAAGVMTVTYATTGGWSLVETHLAAGDALADIPANKKGNPKIGNFAYPSGDITGATTHEVSVPLCEFGLDAADTACDPVKAYLAAHAVVQHDDGSGSVQTETAWGDGERLVKKGSWAEYFNMHLECKDEPEPPPPPVATCETAFALAGNGDETCFIGADFDGDGNDDGFNRWGWSNAVSPGTHMQWPVYAAAGQCNLGNGELVGHLTVDYDGSSATVTFDRIGDFALDEEHLYIGSEPLPRDATGDYTVAPGQYPIVVELDDATQTSHTVDGLGGDIYIVYHAVACGGFDDGDGGGGDGGGSDGGDGGGDGGVCTDPLAALNDDFDGDLSAWSIYNPQDAAVSVTGGALEILPVHGPGWYNGGEAVHVNQPVAGNFAVTSYVTVTDLQGGPTAPGDPYRVGGLMIRDPNSPTVNSYHMGIGNMNTPGVVVVSKSTDDSSSQIGLPNFDLGDGTLAEMKICRVGADVQGLVRLPGQPWTIIDWHVRPDLPTEVVTGPISYAWDPFGAYTDPDLRTTCDYVRYETVETLADCMKDYDPAC
ncbi:MAG: hypothetical protein KDK70_04645 [Myxococcales bacterium]|nr:hypothetical protein [Myxococcales bacterium]